MDDPSVNNNFELRLPSSRWLRMVVLLVCTLWLAFFCFLLVPPQLWHEDRHVRATSGANLKRIGQAAILYASEYGDGQFPDSFESLVRANPNVLDPTLFAAPNAPETAAPDFETMLREPGHISYLWVGTGLTLETANSSAPIAYEPSPVAPHRVLFADTSWRWVDHDEFRKLLSDAEARLKSATTEPSTRPATSPTTTPTSGERPWMSEE